MLGHHDDDVQFSSCSIRIHSSSFKEHSLLSNLQSCSKSLVSQLSNTRLSLTRMFKSLKNRHSPSRFTQTRSIRRPNSPTQMLNSVTQLMIGNSSPISLSLIQSNWSNPEAEDDVITPRLHSPLLCCASLSLTRPNESTQSLEGKDTIQQQKGHSVSRNAEERVLISEVLVRTKDGEELERKDLEMEALAALKACRANSALTIREVQEDVHRIIESGYFCSCTPVAVDTRDGIRLMFQVEPNQEFRGLVCENANVLPSKFIQEAFRDGFGRVINIKRLEEAITSINGWYMERGLFGIVSDIDTLSGGIVRLQVAEAEVNNISIRFLDRKTGEPTKGKTSVETILRQLTTKKGQVYSMLQGKRDVDTVLAMGIMEDVSIIPQPAGDSGKVDLIMNCVERPSGGFSAGGGISSGITSGPLSGLIGSFAYSHRNLFGTNQKLNVSLERGQIDSIFRINYTDPWIEGDDKRTSRSIMVQNSRTPGNLVHGNQPDNGSVTIGRVTAGVEYSRPFRPKWSGTAGLIFQHAGARDEQGNPIIKDFYSSPLTASGKTHDDTLLAKLESIYTGSGDHGSTMFAFNMEQGLPVLPEWLCFNRVTARTRKGIHIGPARFLFSLSGGHVMGNFSPHEAFIIGGTNSVRGYEEGAVGSGRSYVVGSGEISIPMRGPVEGVIFTDYGTDLASGSTVPANQGLATLAFFGVGVNLVLFLTRVLGQGNAEAANNVSKWTGTVYMFSLVGAFLSDSYWGRYLTCTIFQVIFVIGVGLLSFVSWFFLIKPRGCGDGDLVCEPASSLGVAIFYLSVYLVAFGYGGHQPTLATFGADQLDDDKNSKAAFFSYFYFALNVGALFSNTILVYFEDKGLWTEGFLVSLGSAIIALLAFLTPTRQYRYVKPCGNPLPRVAQVFVATVRKWSVDRPGDPNELYEVEGPESAIKGSRKIFHSTKFVFLDRAAVITENDRNGTRSNAWRLCSVTQVEEAKCVMKLLPIWLCTIIYSVIFTQMASLFVEQGDVMNAYVGKFHIPAASMSVFDIFSVFLSTGIYRHIIFPYVRPTELMRMGIGLIIGIMSMVAAGLTEIQRLKRIVPGQKESELTILWQIPQYVLVGASEVFMYVGQLEFFNGQAPDGLKNLGSSLCMASMALGNYVSSLMVNIVMAITKRGESNPGWIPENLNEGHMDRFYFLIAALAAIDFVVYLVFAKWYQPISHDEDSIKGGSGGNMKDVPELEQV